VPTIKIEMENGVQRAEMTIIEDKGRAYHSSYFEMLGEQGYPGLILFFLIHGIGIFRMEILRRRYKDSEADPWLSPLATALQSGHLVYLVGSLFVGIAYQPFVYMLIGTQIGLDTLVRRREREGRKQPFVKRKPGASAEAKLQLS
jgi:hypothetical protein